jgi:hypothetical protein
MRISSPYVLPLDSSIFYRLLLLARAIKFVFCDSTVAVLFYLYIQAVPAGYDLANKGAAIRDGLQPL